jgi:hypothetical protein
LTPVLGELGGLNILADLPSMKQVNPAANAITTLALGPKNKNVGIILKKLHTPS